MGSRVPMGPVMTAVDVWGIVGALGAFLLVLAVFHEWKVSRSRKRQQAEISRAFDQAQRRRDDGTR